jgi:hypothetical protein
MQAAWQLEWGSIAAAIYRRVCRRSARTGPSLDPADRDSLCKALASLMEATAGPGPMAEQSDPATAPSDSTADSSGWDGGTVESISFPSCGDSFADMPVVRETAGQGIRPVLAGVASYRRMPPR